MTNNAPTASLIIIGNEILSGRTQDQNLNYIAGNLSDIGIKFMEVRVIPDIEEDIIKTVNELRSRFDYVFTTGGIGPTHDDITSDSIAKAFAVENIQNQDAYDKLRAFYQEDLNDGRLKMTRVPQGARLIENPISAAPGFCIENVYVMAGIPNVMQAMFDNIKGALKTGDPILSKEIKRYVSESKIAACLSQVQDKYNDVEIGSYPFIQDNKIGVSIVLRSSDKGSLGKVFDELNEKL